MCVYENPPTVKSLILKPRFGIRCDLFHFYDCPLTWVQSMQQLVDVRPGTYTALCTLTSPVHCYTICLYTISTNSDVQDVEQAMQIGNSATRMKSSWTKLQEIELQGWPTVFYKLCKPGSLLHLIKNCPKVKTIVHFLGSLKTYF